MLEVENLAKTYYAKTGPVEAIANITFTVDRGEFVSIVGPSGCGKTTLLRCLGAIQPVSSGSIVLNGREVTSPPKEMGVVFQDYRGSLMPWMTVRKNLALPLRGTDVPRAERVERIEEALHAVGLDGFMDYYPWQLSGGMQQRVAIARALAYRPEILLMDEPFASVDAQTRADLEDLTLRIKGQFDMTILLVTHDVDEAVYLADRVIVLSNRPTSVQEEVAIVLPEPREQVVTKELPDFSHLRAQVFRSVRAQVGGVADAVTN